MPLELMSHEQRARVRGRVCCAHAHLNLLINNAGVMASPLARTAEGWESQFATNHLGHFLFTGLLTPRSSRARRRA